jgi:hypothetical protein
MALQAFFRIKFLCKVRTRMKPLNLFPYYESLIKKKLKCTSLRLGDQTSKYSVGDRIDIKVGWNLENGSSIASAVVTQVSVKERVQTVQDPKLSSM